MGPYSDIETKSEPVPILTEDIGPQQVTWTKEEERKIRLKIDYRVVPSIVVLYLLCFLDRANIGNARIQGLEKDLGLHGYRFNWTLTIFYISYALVEVPSQMLLKIIGARYYIPGLVVAFGLVSMCTAFVHNFAGLMACRFFLGIAEGGMMPGIAFYISCFYRRAEISLRVGFFVNSAALAGAFGGLLAAGLSQIPRWGASAAPIHTWRNIFFFEGLATMIIGLAGMYFLPASPAECRFLSERERAIASERIVMDYQEVKQHRVTKSDVYRGIFNINSTICGLCFVFSQVAVQSLALFMPTILAALGWRAIKAQLYTVPVYTAATVAGISMCALSDRLKMRGPFICGGGGLAMIGYIILITVDNSNAKYGAVYLIAMGVFFCGPNILAWTLNNAAPSNVRAVAAAYAVGLGNCGSIIATWTYLSKDGPRYKKGHSINMGSQVLVVALSLGGVLYTKWENRQRKNGKRDHRLQGLSDDEIAALGYRHPNFRYMA